MKDRRCIIESKNYGGSYYNGENNYTKELIKARIFNENEIPEHIQDSLRERVVYLDSKEALKVVIENIESLISQIKKESMFKLISKEEESLEKLLKSNPKTREMMDNLKGLYNLNPKIINKYLKIHPFIREIRNKDSLIKELIEEN